MSTVGIATSRATRARMTGDATLAIGRAWRRLEPVVRRAAERFTPDDPDLADDLVQEALIRLWEIDPTRFRLEEPQELYYLRRILIHRMFRVWGREVRRMVRN